MAGLKLDGAGQAKMATLDSAIAQIQQLNTVVERMAMNVRNGQPASQLGPQLRRVGTPLIGLLKGQYGMISDQVAAMLLAATRGNNDQMRVRSLREGVAQVKTALEIAINGVKAKHAVVDDHDEPAE